MLRDDDFCINYTMRIETYFFGRFGAEQRKKEGQPNTAQLNRISADLFESELQFTGRSRCSWTEGENMEAHEIW